MTTPQPATGGGRSRSRWSQPPSTHTSMSARRPDEVAPPPPARPMRLASGRGRRGADAARAADGAAGRAEAPASRDEAPPPAPGGWLPRGWLPRGRLLSRGWLPRGGLSRGWLPRGGLPRGPPPAESAGESRARGQPHLPAARSQQPARAAPPAGTTRRAGPRRPAEARPDTAHHRPAGVRGRVERSGAGPDAPPGAAGGEEKVGSADPSGDGTPWVPPDGDRAGGVMVGEEVRPAATEGGLPGDSGSAGGRIEAAGADSVAVDTCSVAPVAQATPRRRS